MRASIEFHTATLRIHPNDDVEYVWCVGVTFDGETAMLHGTVGSPPVSGMQKCLERLRELGIKVVRYERRIKGKPRRYKEVKI